MDQNNWSEFYQDTLDLMTQPRSEHFRLELEIIADEVLNTSFVTKEQRARITDIRLLIEKREANNNVEPRG